MDVFSVIDLSMLDLFEGISFCGIPLSFRWLRRSSGRNRVAGEASSTGSSIPAGHETPTSQSIAEPIPPPSERMSAFGNGVGWELPTISLAEAQDLMSNAGSIHPANVTPGIRAALTDEEYESIRFTRWLAEASEQTTRDRVAGIGQPHGAPHSPVSINQKALAAPQKPARTMEEHNRFLGASEPASLPRSARHGGEQRVSGSIDGLDSAESAISDEIWLL